MQAILITAYRNFSHLEEIINFFREDAHLYIHIDKKSTISTQQKIELSSYKNVKYVSECYTINWGGLNHLKAILLLAGEALSDPENEYIHLITGHDYPIKPLSYFSDFIKKNSDKDFMEFHPMPYSSWAEGGFERLWRYNLYDLMDGRSGWKEKFIKRFSKLQVRLGIKRSFYEGFPDLYGGSTYWSLRRSSLEYVFDYLNRNPRFLNRFKYSFCSEEIFFQTILLNSPFKKQIVNDNMRFIVWEKRNGNYPANLDDTDYENVMKSSALFARKFEYPISQNLLTKIKENVS